MTQATNDQFLLAARPVGMPKDSDWQRATPALGELADGEVRVKILYISLDPAMRGWMNDARSYVRPVAIGEVMRAGGVGVLLREVSIKFDHVIVDTPAAVFGSDGVVIASRCGSALVVTRKNANKVDRLQELVASLQSGQVRLAGVIMNEL